MQKNMIRIAGGALAFVVVASLAACAPAAPAEDAKGPLVVWVDAARVDRVQAYADANGAENFDIITVNADELTTKLGQVKDDPGTRPDVVFTPNGDVAKFQTQYGIVDDLTSAIPADTQENFGGTLSACVADGKLLCLPGDVSTTMLWYNPVLMAQFGYDIPTTFEEYAAVGEKVAAEHPGYVIGSCADWACPNVLFRSNGCDGVDSNNGVDAVVYLAKDPKCQEVADLIDPLLANGSVANLGPFDADMATLIQDQKVLMLPGFVWYAGALYADKTPDGTLAAAPMPTWSDGAVGLSATVGAQWFILNTSEHKDAAKALILDQTTNLDVLSSQEGFPPYVPAQETWAATQAKKPIFGTDPTDTFVGAGKDISDVDLFVQPGLDLLATFSSSVGPLLKEGGKLATNLGTWQDALVQNGSDFGLTVTVK